MTRTKQWKITLIALCAVLVLSLAAVGISAIVQNRPTAQAEIVFSENTADYTFTNDEQYPWFYNRVENVWNSTNQGVKKGKTILTLDVTGDGNIVLEYRVSSEARFDWLCITHISGEQSTALVGADKNAPTADKSSNDNKEFTRLSIDVKTGDQVTFKYEKDSSGDEFEDTAYIKGLKMPTGSFGVEAKAQGEGTVQLNGSDNLNQTLDIGSQITLTANPNDGYGFSYWCDENGAVVSNKQTYVTYCNSNASYTAMFHSLSNKDPFYTASGQSKWKEHTGDKTYWYVDHSDGIDYSADVVPEKASDAITTLIYEFDGAGYVYLDYALAGDRNDVLEFRLDGEIRYPKPGSTSSLSPSSTVNNDPNAEATWFKGVVTVATEGHHVVELIYKDSTTSTTGEGKPRFTYAALSYYAELPDFDKFEIEVQYDNRFADVYIDEKLVVPGKVSVSKLMSEQKCIPMRIEVSKTAQSTIDPTQNTSGQYIGVYARKDYVAAMNNNGVISGNKLSGTLKFENGKLSSFNSSFSNAELNDEGFIGIRVEEIAPQLKNYTVTTNVDGQAQDTMKPFESDHKITLSFGKPNKITVNADLYDKLTQGDIVGLTYRVQKEDIYTEDSLYNEDLKVTTELGKMCFIIENVDSECTFYFSYFSDDYYETDFYKLHVEMDTTKDIQTELIKSGNVTVENDQEQPWEFCAELSTTENKAFISGNRSWGGENTISNLHFKTTGEGVLRFEFSIDSARSGSNYYYSMAGYKYGSPLEIFSSTKVSDNAFVPQGGVNLATGDSRTSGEGYFYPKYTPEIISDYVTFLETDEKGYQWLQCSIPVSTKSTGVEVSEQTVTDVYVAFANLSGYTYIFNYMAIRNVQFATLSKLDVKFGLSNGDCGSISASAGTVDIATGNQVDWGTKVTFTAKPNESSNFYAWKDKSTGKILSYDKTLTVTVTDNIEVEAVVEPKGHYAARVGDTFYTALKDALTAAADGQDKKVYIADSVKVTGNVTVEAGVTLVLPIDPTGKYYDEGSSANSQKRVSWATDALVNQYRKIVLTIDSDSTITIYGTFYVGGVTQYPDQSAQAHTSGAYSELQLDGHMIVENGGVFDVYGRVTGNGDIIAHKGGKIYQPFLILDYSGGTNTEGLFDANITPFNRYAMINIQCKGGYTIEYGAELIGHASLYFWSSYTTLDQPFISYVNGGTTTLINLHDGAKALVKYDDSHVKIPDAQNLNNTESIGQTTITITGDADAGYMDFLGIVQTDEVAFSIPYNYNLVLESGTFNLNNHFKLMPGASLTVGQNATFNVVEGVKFFVYDGLIQTAMSGKTYPTAQALTKAGYNTNATFIVNGTLNIMNGATFVGVIQSKVANATIDIKEGAIIGEQEDLTVVDGGRTSYDCNYFTFKSSARVWDSVKQKLCKLSSGRVYKSVVCDEWTLNGIQITYEKGGKHTADAGHSLEQGTLSNVTGMHGSWVGPQHSQHVIDWNYQDGDVLPTEENKHVTLKRYCSELGCTYNESRELLYAPQDWGQITYTGSQFTDDQVKAAINSLFGEDYDLFQAAGATLGYTPFTVVNDDGYDVTITLTKGYWVNGSYSTSDVTLTKRIKVSPAELTASNVDEIQAVTYSGEAHRPEVTLKFNGEPLTLDSDYNVSYSSNTNAGEATIHISVVNKNFSGEFDVHFTINPRDISDAQITDLVNCTYSGKAQKLTPTVTVADKRLTAEDFTTAYNSDSDGEACIAVGTVTVTVNGQGNYSGSKTATYKITPKDVSKIAKLDIKEYTYNGKVQELELTVTVDGFEQPLQKDVDYQATCDEILNVTDYTVTVQFQGNFAGSATGKLVVNRKNLADKDVVIEGLKQSYEYTGSAITPSITVKFEGITLDLYADGSGDYVVTYGANINVASGGTVKIVAGEDENSNFTGEKEVEFTITPKDASLAGVKESGTHVYNAQTQSAVVTVTLAGFTITEGDYTISYGESDRVNAGTVNFTVQFTGNYSGSATSSFEIGRAAVKVTPKGAETPEGKEVADLNYEITGEMYGDDKSTLEGGITLKLDGEVADKHAGDTLTISVEISAEVLAKLSNYNIDSSATAVYTISESVFKDVSVTDVTAPYDGKQHPVVVSGQPLGAATSVKYTLNDEPIQGEPTDVGNYSATIQITLEGYREYSITRSVKITAKQLTVELQKQTVVYSGTAQHPNNDSRYWIVNGAVEGESVTLTLSASLTDVGKADIVATLVAGDNTKLTNYSCDQASLTLKNGFEVTAKNIAELEFGGVESSYEYSGKAIRPEPTVKYGSITLGKEDYSVVYGNNTTVAEGGTVSVSGTGNYTGSKELTFKITAKNADSAQITVTGTYTYTGKEQNVSVEITLAGYTVTSDDYTTSYVTSDRTNVGTVRFEVQFKNNFAGTKDDLSFEITPKNASLTVNEVKFTFDRKEHTAANATYAFADLVDGDESEIVVTFEGSGTEVGKYDVTAKFTGAKAANYTISVDGDEKLVIEAAKIDGVEVTSEHVYNGKDQTPTLTVKAGDLVLNSDEYNIGYVGNRKNAGNVTVNVEAASKNFTGSKSTEFTIQKAPVSVTVNDQQSVYGDDFVTEFTFVAEGVLDEEQNMVIIKDYLEFSCNASAAKDVDDYEIKATVTSQPSNYQITVVKQGTYKVTPKPVTVKIADQNSVFGYNKAYALDNTLWSVEGELANGEEKNVLQVTLSIPEISTAGTYAITGSYDNNNYTVTFEGSYEGTKGTFTVAKKTVQDNVDGTMFQALVNGEQWQADENYKLADGSLTFSCLVYVQEEDNKPLKVKYTCGDQNKVSELSLTEEGVYEITVEIDDVNYQGSATYSLEIVGADGRTQHLKDVLDALKERAGELTPETLTTTNECFETLNFIKKQVDSLSEDEQAMAEEDLAPYLELVEAWNNAVDKDVIVTAQAIAQAPINGLMVIASLNAIVMAVYVIGKGGLLR